MKCIGLRAVARVAAAVLLASCGSSPPPNTIEVCLPQPAQGITPAFKPVNLTAGVDLLVQSIMPPGQSGHFPSAASCPGSAGSCAAPGQSPETYGPHIDDQRLMYWRSQFKPGAFFDTAGQTPALTFNLTTPVTDTVKVWRDAFGVPVVHAATAYGVWYGAGYALAQDRLFLIDQAIRQGRGTSAATNGTGSGGKTLGADVQTRVLTYSEAEYQATFDALSERAKTAINAHVAGINAWIETVNADGSGALKPQEMVALNYTPHPITPTDVLALGVLMTRLVASEGGDEMVNVRALQELEAQHGEELGRRIFRDVMWQDDRKADVTITDQEFTNVSTPRALREAAFERAADFAATLPLELADGDGTGAHTVASAAKLRLPPGFKWPAPPALLARALGRWQDLPRHVSASYMMVASPDITADHSTLLVNGPQLGYSYPTLLAEIEVHGGGYDARGATVAGAPVVGIGYGERTVWGLTTGESKTIDSFIVELDPNDGHRYRYQGEFHDMECRTETVSYRSTSNGVPNVSEPEPGVNSTDIEVCRTRYGPVVARSADGKFARSVQYAMWKREIETVEGILDWNRVDTAAEFYEAMSKVSWNENTMYADADGNIAYYHPGLHPWRHPSADQRLPLRGDGSQDACGTLSFEKTPKSINPARGYLHNWNNKPALGWGEGEGGDADQVPSAADGRNTNWEKVIRQQLDGDGLTHADLVGMDQRVGRIDERAAALLAPILSCDGGCGLSAQEQALVTLLKGWDRQHYNDAIDITVEPTANSDPNATDPYAPASQQPDSVRDTAGATIFGHIIQAMVDDVVTGVLPDAFVEWHARRGRHPYDVGTFHKLLARILDPGKSTIAAQYDWLKGRSKAQFLKDAIGVALGRMQTEYGTTDPAQFRRIHARADVCALADPLVGPCLTMPHQDRGSWLKIVGFVPR
jgi:penicillin amidase